MKARVTLLTMISLWKSSRSFSWRTSSCGNHSYRMLLHSQSFHYHRRRTLKDCHYPYYCRRSSRFFDTTASNNEKSDNARTTNDSSMRRKYEIQWKTSDKGTIVFEAFDGETLRTAALRRNLVSPHNGRARLVNCRGLGTCGTCAVHIGSNSMVNVEPRERNAVERARLSFPPHGPLSSQSPQIRLACQVQIRGDVVVTKRKGFWGQYDQLAKASPAQTYFGELEFLLDRKSPTVPRSSSSTYNDMMEHDESTLASPTEGQESTNKHVS